LNNPKVSIITICFNAENTISDTIQSVINQTYQNIEYIIVDGASKDQTLNIVNSFSSPMIKVISEPDKGLYDALNKGFKMATGDIIAALHADDLYASNHVIDDVVDLFLKHQTEAVSSSVYIFKHNDFKKPYRKYQADKFREWQLRMGIQPPHPGFFISKQALLKVGYFDIKYKISGDFDWLLRAIKVHRLRIFYSPYVSVWMRDGGISSSGWKSKVLMNQEDLDALKKNGFYSNLPYIYLKYLIKIFQMF
jgi:glycosyltransferase involved in cell wall biosynthesis